MKMAPYFRKMHDTLRDDALTTIRRYVKRSGGGVDFKSEHQFTLPQTDETLATVSGLYAFASGVSDVLHVQTNDAQTWEEDLNDQATHVLLDIIHTIEEQEGYEI